MLLHVFLSLLMSLFILAVVWLSHRYRLHHGPAHGTGASRSLLPRRLKPRTPLDCPACCLSASRSLSQRPESVPVRPWQEIKSRWGAPKRVKTAGFACPNRACGYYGITDTEIHALVGDGLRGQSERIQRFRCQACQTTFSARLHTPLYRLKTSSHRVGLVLAALAEGLDVSAAERVFGIRHATITRWLSEQGAMPKRCMSAPSAICRFPICNWMNSALGCAATPRCSGSGSPSIRSPSVFRCCIWVRGLIAWPTCSSTACENSWLPAVCRSSPAMASTRTSTPSLLILGTGSRKLGARRNSGRWPLACSMAKSRNTTSGASWCELDR